MAAVPTPMRTGARWPRIKAALTPAEWRRAGALAAAVLGLHVAGFAILLLAVVPRHYDLGASGVFGLGLGMTAYTLGLRHAFDADHIGAIDNTTRKLMGEGQRPLSVGFYFSLGHSTIVFVLGLLVVLGVRGLERRGPGRRLDAAPGDRARRPARLGVVPLLGPLNLVDPAGVLGCCGAMRRGACDEAELRGAARRTRVHERASTGARRGPCASRGRCTRWGCLFGLGFDTATEVALLVLAGAGAAGGCRSTRSSACRSSSRRGCRSSTRSTGRS